MMVNGIETMMVNEMEYQFLLLTFSFFFLLGYLSSTYLIHNFIIYMVYFFTYFVSHTYFSNDYICLISVQLCCNGEDHRA